MTIVLTPLQHFQGGSHLTPDPVAGNRDLAVQLREIQANVNAMESSIVTPITSAATFPTLAAVIDGQIYRVTVAATDNNAARTNTGQTFRAGDEIIWNGTDWTLLGHGVSIVTPAAIGVAAAGTNADKSNSDHVHAHGNQLGGTLHADVVAGVSAGFMTAAQATTLASVADDHVFVRITALDLKTDEQNKTANLSGNALLSFAPTHAILKVTATAGALNADGTINIGTAADGTQLVSGAVLTGLTALGATRTIALAGTAITLAANGAIHFNVEAAETGAGTLELDLILVGRQV